jgi:type III restriction enzyme
MNATDKVKGASAYKHLQDSVQRPDVGVEAQFPTKKPSRSYRYDSSLAPELSWDESEDRSFAEWLLNLVIESTEKGEAVVFDSPQTWTGTQPDGGLSAYGPGQKSVLSLKEWRGMFREQQVAFKLAREICVRWQNDNGAAAVPVQVLFPKIAFAAKRFLSEKLDLKGESQPCDVLLVGETMQAAVNSLLDSIKKGSSSISEEVAVIPQGASGRGSTLFADFHTTKPIYPVTKCHLNAMVADTMKWEQSAGFLLDCHPGVKKWVKNERLGFVIPYRNKGLQARYFPDFVVQTDTGITVVVEIKGQLTDGADAKAKAAERWVKAVNRLGEHGTWSYMLVTDPSRVAHSLNAHTAAKWDQGQLELI